LSINKVLYSRSVCLAGNNPEFCNKLKKDYETFPNSSPKNAYSRVFSKLNPEVLTIDDAPAKFVSNFKLDSEHYPLKKFNNPTYDDYLKLDAQRVALAAIARQDVNDAGLVRTEQIMILEECDSIGLNYPQYAQKYKDFEIDGCLNREPKSEEQKRYTNLVNEYINDFKNKFATENETSEFNATATQYANSGKKM
jgi:hypothetical protein